MSELTEVQWGVKILEFKNHGLVLPENRHNPGDIDTVGSQDEAEQMIERRLARRSTDRYAVVRRTVTTTEWESVLIREDERQIPTRSLGDGEICLGLVHTNTIEDLDGTQAWINEVMEASGSCRRGTGFQVRPAYDAKGRRIEGLAQVFVEVDAARKVAP